MKKLTKVQVEKMTAEELQATRTECEVELTSDISEKDANIIKGYIGMIDVELASKQPSEELIVEEAPAAPQNAEVLDSVLVNIQRTLDSNDPANTKLALIMKYCEQNVDYSQLPYELCSDAELLRRLKLLWSKRVAAKKTADFAKLDEIEQEEALINQHRTAKSSRTGAVSSDNVDHSKMTQIDLQKLIRNYQSKKSNAKKLYEAAVAEGDTKLAEDQKNLMEHWQAKVDDASKYRTGSPAAARSAELTKQIQDMLTILKSLPETEEIAAQIKKLEATL